MRSIKFKIALLLLFSSLAAFAQTEEEIREIQKSTNVDTLRKMAAELKIKYEIERKKLLELAKINGWPISIDLPNGGKKELMDVTSDMKPIYSQTFDAGSAKMMGVDQLNTGGSLGLNVNGESMTAVVFEDNPRVTHEAFEGRVQYMGPEGVPVSSHTTGVTGAIAASKLFKSGNARGIAPKANVHVYGSWEYGGELEATVASNGFLVSNHSYGGDRGRYGSISRNLDAIMYNAPYYLSVWSCGNFVSEKVNAPEKNGISVAAVEQVDDYTGPSSVKPMSFPGGTHLDGTTPGPSDDGRIKPDIAAKGVSVYMPAFKNTAPSDNFYASGTGTSFASPAIAGSILLLQQHFTNINNRFMKGATVKALIASSAKEAGPNPGQDVTFGWGLMDVEKAAKTITNNGGKSLISEDKILNGYAYSREIVADGSEPLVATISWTDPPGPIRLDNDPTSVLVNDLDLRLSANSTTYFPWKLDWSNGKISARANPALQGDNNRDNTEKIEIPNPVAGQVYTLTVNHKGLIDTVGQAFSIVITGLKECVAARNIVSPVNSFASVTEQASSVITLSNTLDSNAHAIYHAGDEVVLAAGFTATRDSQFRGYVEGCTNDYAARLRAVERPVVTYPMPISEVIETELPENAVYPNPGNGIFKVNLNGIPSGKVEVTGTDGKAMFDKSFKNQPEMEVDIRNSTPGIYILRVVSDQKVLTRKIVKK